jgi:hypothetical protein
MSDSVWDDLENWDIKLRHVHSTHDLGDLGSQLLADFSNSLNMGGVVRLDGG